MKDHNFWPSICVAKSHDWGQSDWQDQILIEDRELEENIKMLVTENKHVRRHWLPKQNRVDKVIMFCQQVANSYESFSSIVQETPQCLCSGQSCSFSKVLYYTDYAFL